MEHHPPHGVDGLRPVRSGPGRRASDDVHAELVDAIRTVRLAPGADISETELTAALGVSRTPIREAITRLAQSGLLTVEPRVGTRVAVVRLDEVLDAQFTREHLEVAAVACACADPDRDITALQPALAAQRKAIDAQDASAFFAADEAFHEAVFGLIGREGAWRSFRTIKVHLDRVRRLGIPDIDTLRDFYADHEALVAALEAGDADAARAVASAHARLVLDLIPELSRRHPDWIAS